MEVTCKPLQDRPTHYQQVVSEYWMHYHDRTIPLFGYLRPICETDLCTEVEHLELTYAVKLDYPAGVCVYCGLAGNSVDHILPRTWTGDGGARSNVYTVPSCAECNSAINDAYAPSITLRREIAHKYIRRRYRSVLRMILPTPDELEEYGPGLRSYIEDGIANRELILDRLNWPPVGFDQRAAERSGIDPYESGLIHG
jgi:hypothetical protein